MKSKLLIICLVLGILNVHVVNAVEKNENSKTTTQVAATAVEATVEAITTAATKSVSDEATKDKRQIGAKDTQVYPNHRSVAAAEDDPENPQETIYGPKPNQFIIRPIAPHQHQEHEEHQQPQLRNYPATIRPHSTQLLEQSQEIQHFAYLHDISRNQPKGRGSAERAEKGQHRKTQAAARSQQQYSNNAEEAEQRYAVAIQAPTPQVPQARQYQPASSPHAQAYHLTPAQQQQQQHQQQQQQHLQQQYQIIPEEHFLRLIEEELQARAYHEQQVRQQGVYTQTATAATAANDGRQQTERTAQGLGNYRQRPQEEPAPPEYVQYVPRHRGGPKYLPLTQEQHQQQQHQQQQQQQQQQQHQHVAPVAESQLTEPEAQQPPQLPQPYQIPPQLAYYQPQISYKTLPSHPLSKSSLEKEIEKLIAANKPSAAPIEIIDNSNEPSAKINQHHQPPPPSHPFPSHPFPSHAHAQAHAHAGRTLVQPKAYSSSTTPNTLLDANNQPFIPSLFQFSNFQAPTPIYPTPVAQQLIENKKVGPVVYPTQQPTPQPSQYYYQEATPTPKAKAYRPKHYGIKIGTSPKPREKELIKYPTATAKYTQPLLYEFENQVQPQHTQTGPVQFSPSPLDPTKPQSTTQPTHAITPAHRQPQVAEDYRQFVLPAPAPSQSSIFVSQGTGISTPSRPSAAHHEKTVDDVKQLHLPQPGGKPLTQAEFQALIDAGYPVTAVPVPVPVPYDQYIKDHPQYRNQPIDYSQLMRNFAQQPYAHLPSSQAPPPPGFARSRHHSLSHPHQHAHSLGAASEPSVKIISSPVDQQSQAVSAVGGGSVTYLRPINEQQRRHPREENETKVEGTQEVKP